MPTLATIRVPPPMDGIEFQLIVLDALRRRWRNAELEVVGRLGQAQDGVDIAGPDDLGRGVGVQCKCVQKLTMDTIKAEVKSAENFEPLLEAYYIATSLRSDASLQKEVRTYTAERRKTGAFPVGIIFWDAIIVDLAADPAAFRKHFPFVGSPIVGSENASGHRPLSLLDLAYVATDVDVYLGLLFGEIGSMAGEDPYSIAKYTADIESCAVVLLDGDSRERLQRLAQDLGGAALRVALGRPATGESWDTVKGMGTQIEAVVASLQNRLTGRELAVYSVGRGLARWHAHLVRATSKSVLSKKLVEEIMTFSQAAGLSDAFRAQVLELEATYRRDESVSVVHIPNRLYNAARSELYAEAVRTKPQ